MILNQLTVLHGVAPLAVCGLLASTSPTYGQVPPVNGISPSDVRWDAIEHATIQLNPHQSITDGTIVMRDGWITAVGPAATTVVPEGATRHDGTGRTILAGFVEPALLVNSSEQARRASSQDGAHWNALVTPQVTARDLGVLAPDLRKEMRKLGFTAATVYPENGIFRGSGALTLLGEPDAGNQVLDPDAAQLVGFGKSSQRIPRSESPDEDRGGFPNSKMGAIALVRQTLLDAAWRAKSVDVWHANPVGNDPPAASDALDTLRGAVEGQRRVLFDCASVLDELRAGTLIRDFALNGSILGSGMEFLHLSDIAALKRPVIATLEFPKAPDISSRQLAASASLRDLESWALAPSNASRMMAAGLDVSLSTARLSSRGKFPARIRDARDAGLSAAQLIAALTTSPALLAGKSDLIGTLEVGKLANLTVCDGFPFAEESTILEVWIAGRRHPCADPVEGPPPGSFRLSGRFGYSLPDMAPRTIVIDSRKGSVTIEVPREGESPRRLDASGVALEELRGRFQVDGSAFAIDGPARCALRIEGESLSIEAVDASGTPRRFTATRAAAAAAAQAADPAKDTKDPKPDNAAELWAARREVPVSFPMGDFGLPSVPTPQNVVFRNATVWTSTPAGILESTDVLVRGGVITAIGKDLTVPSDVREIDCTGQHLTPGMIDCHSHTGIDGSVNESTQACTAEVRIEDVLDPDDVAWYRELAGGVTAVNQLHGSANPIGGQNCVVKVKWGSPVGDWRARGAKPGIKFALGENVVRAGNRYPNTRMGVEAFLRDRFDAARHYRQEHSQYAQRVGAGMVAMPPRVDLELEALAEILEGKRIIHCHSYRQDEVLMLIRLADELGIRIGTLQHILEGYKVADAISRHGAGASCFSDWWAYKVEVMDAIPWAGAMMLDQGIVVSFNSDSDEVARHLNTEAAKAVKYGNVDRSRALEFVTINPARQVGLGERTGSIEVGKDADIVIWSGDPLSSLSMCMQTWVEGTKRFDRNDDLAARGTREALRQRLIAAVTITPKPPPSPPAKEAKPPAAQPTRLIERMLMSQDDLYLDLWRRGRDIGSLRSAGLCGCIEDSQ